MNITKAIELTTQLVKTNFSYVDQDHIAAILLGVQALKRLQLARHGSNSEINRLLPGETHA